MLPNTPHPVHIIARNSFIKQNASFNELWNFASNTKKIILNWSVMLLEIGSTDLLFYSDPKTLFFFGEGGINQGLQGIYNFFHVKSNLST
jgi:hypothetical protein